MSVFPYYTHWDAARRSANAGAEMTKGSKRAPILDRDKGHTDEPASKAEAKEAPPEPRMGADRAAGQPPLADVNIPPMVGHEPGNSIPGGNGSWVRRDNEEDQPT